LYILKTQYSYIIIQPLSS